MPDDDRLYFVDDDELADEEGPAPIDASQVGPVPADLRLRCVECDYDLTGLTARICPECGEPFDVTTTHRINQRESWQYLMESRATPVNYVFFQLARMMGVPAKRMNTLLWAADYAFKGSLLAMVIFFVIKSTYNQQVLFALMLAIPAELIILATGRGRIWFRFFVWLLCTIFAILV